MAVLKHTQFTAALTAFYQRPVALVSMELLLSVSLVVFLGAFAITPTLQTMSDLIKEREDKIKLADQLDKKIASLETAQGVYTQILPNLNSLDEAMPQQPELVRSLKIVEKHATENNVIINSIGVSRIPDEKLPNPKATIDRVDLPISVSITGEYLAIRSFVAALQDTKRSFIVKSVTFSLQESRGSKKLSASISLDAPYLGVPIE